MRRSCLLALAAVTAAVPLLGGRAAAVPPPGASMSGTQLGLARWIEHRVIFGERLRDIAKRYHVEVDSLIEWNALDPDRPRIRAGQKLRVFTTEAAAVRKRKSYVVRAGDSWSRIARRFDVPIRKLRDRWNAKMSDELRAGDRVVIWVELDPEEAAGEDAADDRAKSPAPTRAEAEGGAKAKTSSERERASAKAAPSIAAVERASTSGLEELRALPAKTSSGRPDLDAVVDLAPPIVPVPSTGLSVGSPSRGRLLRGVQLPPNDALYRIRNPDHSYGSSYTIEQLQRALHRFRKDTGFDREILVCDMSRRYGGRFRPHSSHTSGRDVDIQLPLAKDVPDGTVPMELGQVDWDATYALVQSLVSTGAVKYIFLSRSRQRALYDAALRAGASREELRSLIQYPFHDRTALVRHSSGHVKHLHVRFTCAPHETKCRDM